MLSQHVIGQVLRDPVATDAADLASIHALPNPPLVQLKADDIHVRRCRLASDAIDSRHGRFRTDDLPRLLELTRGAPVLVGHDRRTLGVARFFGGTVERRGDRSWIVPRFYWPRAHSQAEDLRLMIDSGVYSEASIAFTYRTPTCSVCGRDIRSCPHWPGREYEGASCFFYYDGIERVTEGSLVYRGAAFGTGFELTDGEHDPRERVDNQGEEGNGVGGVLELDGDRPDPTPRALASPPVPAALEHGPTLTLKHRGRRYLALLQPLDDARSDGESPAEPDDPSSTS